MDPALFNSFTPAQKQLFTPTQLNAFETSKINRLQTAAALAAAASASASSQVPPTTTLAPSTTTSAPTTTPMYNTPPIGPEISHTSGNQNGGCDPGFTLVNNDGTNMCVANSVSGIGSAIINGTGSVVETFDNNTDMNTL
jgi:hypothetical protein